jgi:diguanylate cyclase (GGDEF)-like protein
MASVSELARVAKLRGAALRFRLTHSRGWAYAIGVAIFIGALLAAEFTYSLLQRELEARARADALRFASALRASLERELNAVLFLSSGLGSYLSVRRNNLDDGEVRAILAALYRDARHVRNFGIAIGYRIAYIYPMKGNAAAIGMYYPDQPSQWPSVQRAIASNRGTLAGPLTLIQGGEGLIFRLPVRIKGEYWGLLSTVIDIQSLLAAATAELRDEPYDFAIRGRDGLGAQGDVFAGNPELFDGRAVTLESTVPNGRWVLAVRPRAAAASGRFALVLRVMGWGLAALLGFATMGILTHRIDLAQLALFDPLTALPNRRYFEDSLAVLLNRTLRGGRVCGVLFIDLDGFKAINDNHGHKAGDLLLKTVGDRVSQQVRSHDTVARWGGDELVVVVDDTDLGQLLMLADRLRNAIEQPVDYDGLALRVGASIGHALPPNDGVTPRELLKVADQRMYEQKQQRKNLPA